MGTCQVLVTCGTLLISIDYWALHTCSGFLRLPAGPLFPESLESRGPVVGGTPPEQTVPRPLPAQTYRPWRDPTRDAAEMRSAQVHLKGQQKQRVPSLRMGSYRASFILSFTSFFPSSLKNYWVPTLPGIRPAMGFFPLEIQMWIKSHFIQRLFY